MFSVNEKETHTFLNMPYQSIVLKYIGQSGMEWDSGKMGQQVFLIMYHYKHFIIHTLEEATIAQSSVTNIC